MHRHNGSSPYSPESSSCSSNSPAEPARFALNYSNSNSPPERMYSVLVSPRGEVQMGAARLRILNQPQEKFRFRYASEMTGTHGCLMAESKDRNKKDFIRVQLEGCREPEAFIRCTLVANHAKTAIPHVHRLGGEGNPNDGDHQDIPVSLGKNEWIATFSGLTIIHTAKKQVRDVIEKRLLNENEAAQTNRLLGQQLKDEADKIANTMDLHSVKLKFEAFVDRNGTLAAIAPPVYSHAIHNLKSTHAGDLRIVRIDKVFSCCTGQEEIFIFVEKVNKKDIKIRFFELDENDQETWHAFADFSELDVHHQYAIAFKTPAYANQNIKSDVTVQFQLYRPSNGSTSEAKSFTYTPREIIGNKRPRRDVTCPSESPANKYPHQFPSPPSQNGANNQPGPNSPYDYSTGDSNSGNQHRYIVQGSHHDPLADVPVGSMIPIYFDPSRTIDSNLMTWNSTLVQQQIQPQQMQQQEQLQQSFNFQQQQQLPQFVIQPQQQDAGLWPSNPNNNIANQQWDSELTEDLFRMVMNELDANQPAVQPTLIEVNPQHTDDDILAGIWEINDFTTDAVSASNNNTMEDRLARRINQMTLSDDNNQKQKEQQSPPYPGKNTKTYPHSIAMGLARALRSYAVTGNMTHILMRLHHLFAIQSEDGDNALHDALVHGQIGAVHQILKAASYNVNKRLELINAQNNAKLTPLHVAVLKKQTDAVALLLQNGADPSLTDVDGNTPIHLASADMSNQSLCLKLLLLNSCHKNLKLDTVNHAGLAPLHIAVNSINGQSVRLLLTAGADVNCCEQKRGRAALHLAVKKRASDIIMTLLDQPSVDVDLQSYDGNTALHLAVVDELDDICSILVNDGGADSNLENFICSSSSSGDDYEEYDQSDDDVQQDGPGIKKGRTPLDLTRNTNQSIYRILTCSTDSKMPMIPDDSGFDLMASKELLQDRELDSGIISELATLLDGPDKKWEMLADSLNLLSSMRSVFDKQTSPASYLLTNLDLWEVSTHSILEKLNQLQFRQAAAVLEQYLLR